MATEMKSETSRKRDPFFLFAPSILLMMALRIPFIFFSLSLLAELGLNFSQVGLLKGVFQYR